MSTNKDKQNVYDAKKVVKEHIQFFQALLKHLNGTDEVCKGRAMWASWCMHRYVRDGLSEDIKIAMKEHAMPGS